LRIEVSMNLGAGLSTDVTKLPPEEQARIQSCRMA
jgi:hypothetical protein